MGAVEKSLRINELFRKFAKRTAELAGSPWAFILALAIIVLWALSGPLFGFSDTWQLVINTGTTIVTFLMVFLIQNSQNRDAQAVHLKLDELIRAVAGARNTLVDLENVSDEELLRVQAEFHRLREHCGSVAEPMLEILNEELVQRKRTSHDAASAPDAGSENSPA